MLQACGTGVVKYHCRILEEDKSFEHLRMLNKNIEIRNEQI